jgi:hypothetical protein
MTDWAVITTSPYGGRPAYAYYAFDESADDQAGKPFDEQTARQLAANINQFHQTRGWAYALPLQQTLQPGV